MKLTLPLSHLRYSSGGAKPFSGGAKCPLCPLLEKSLPNMYMCVCSSYNVVWLMTLFLLYSINIGCVKFAMHSQSKFKCISKTWLSIFILSYELHKIIPDNPHYFSGNHLYLVLASEN